MQDFRLRRGRQLVAIAAALLLIIFLALISNRSDLFGNVSKNTISAMELVVIAAFIGFSSANWRCPSCNRYLGQDINRSICKKCGARLR
jgi:hypothetical protein